MLGHCKDFINFDLLDTYKDFGGIRIEDDVLITAEGCRFLGAERIPYHTEEVEAFLEKHNDLCQATTGFFGSYSAK